MAAVGGGQNDLYANFNSARPRRSRRSTCRTLQIKLDGSQFTAPGGKLALSKVATDVLKQQFGMAVPTGTAMGTVDIAGQLSGQYAIRDRYGSSSLPYRSPVSSA